MNWKWMDFKEIENISQKEWNHKRYKNCYKRERIYNNQINEGKYLWLYLKFDNLLYNIFILMKYFIDLK